MEFISIGNACNVKHQIDSHNIKNKTLFFDWLVSDMKFVLEILETSNIENIINLENIILKSDNKTIFFNLSSTGISYHDIHENHTLNDLNNFVEKYKRRYFRIIEKIKSNNTLYFLRYDEKKNISEQDVKRFNEAILKINDKCIFYFVFIDKSNNSNTFQIINNYIQISTTHENIENYHWTTPHINWSYIFEILKKNNYR
jgi:hypothetical protein